jgi:hypothetical protein
MKAYGGVDVLVHVILASALARGEWSISHPCRFTLGERATSTHWIRGWVGTKTGLDMVENKTFLTLLGLELRIHNRPARSQTLYQLRYPGSLNDVSISSKLSVWKY